MPRHSKTAVRKLPDNTLIIDNGGYTLKAGFSQAEATEPDDCYLIPNCLARGRDRRVWVGANLENCKDFGEMAFRRPVEKGYIVNWDVEKEIWSNTFFDNNAPLKCDPHETNLILTEAPNALSALQLNCDQMVFEEFEFASYYRCVGPSLNSYNDIQALYDNPKNGPAADTEALIVIDSGYSHTTVTPILRGKPIQAAIRRLNVGGKLLTNFLKELVSIRHYNMMDETHLMNEIKEAVCYVSNDFKADLERTWKGGVGDRREKQVAAAGIVVDYVLPDYNTKKKGFVRPHQPSASGKLQRLASNNGESVEDFMTLGNERFTVPELLFSPSDVGMREAGLAEVILESLNAVPGGLWPALLANIVVVGGNALLDGFLPRLCVGATFEIAKQSADIHVLEKKS
ncbi:MAG: hypothetical protein M1825_002136 [Sarcosagium campestre]|nr:MAG: hypothetical protein M1825_002136 [Sarcosagium campestre]